MLHVFIDTNVLLRFYGYSDDTLVEVEKLSALVKSKQLKLLVTQQVVDERARNRDKEVSESVKRLEQLGLSVQMPRFAEHHNAASDFTQSMKVAKAAKSALLSAISLEMAHEGLRADRVIQDMFDASVVLERTSEIINRARLRRELGNPPGKRDSLGDQINWEIILENVPTDTDLHIVSRDADFKGGVVEDQANFFLRGEWNVKKKGNLFLYQGLAEFTKSHFTDIKVPSDAIKAAAIKELVSAGFYAQTHSAIAKLQPIIEEIEEKEALAILTAVTVNSQISDILADADVEQFYKALHLKFILSTSPALDEELENTSSIFGIPF